MMVIFVFLLSKGLGLSTGNIPAPLYYLSGLLVWNLFNHTVANAANAMVSHGNIIKKIYFPRLIIPISAALTASFDFLISLMIFCALILYYQFTALLDISWLLLICSMVTAYMITIVVAFSLGTLLSAINVKYRDVRYLLPFILQTLFFITPVMYDADSIKQEWISQILLFNPLNYAITMVRENITSGSPDIISYPWHLVIVLILSYMLGIITFRKMEAYFADLV